MSAPRAINIKLSTWLISAVVGAAVLACMMCTVFASDITRYDNILDPGPIGIWCWTVNGVILAGAVLALRRLQIPFFRIASPVDLLWTVLMALFYILVVGRVTYVGLSSANRWFDHSPGSPASVAVTGRHSQHNLRSGPDYHVTVTLDGKPVEFEVTAAQYQGLNTGDSVGLKLHPGALGFAWADVPGKGG